jgi:hypothetical protein
MRNATFNRLTENVKIKAGIRYRIGGFIKNNKDSTGGVVYVGIKNGKTALFYSTGYNGESYKSSRNWLFVKVPPGAKFYSFPSATRAPAGWDLGQIEWHF